MNTNVKKIVRISFLSVFLIFIVTYVFFRTKDLVNGVKIINVSMVANGLPVQEGTKVPDNILKITGNARNAINLTLDDREISVDQSGNFDETIALLPGYNVIDIKAEDKFGKSDEKNYKLMY
jgi:hypothetical protein